MGAGHERGNDPMSIFDKLPWRRRAPTHATDPVASQQAAAAVEPSVLKAIDVVRLYADRAGAQGFTDDELRRDHPVWGWSTLATRRGQLVTAGELYDTGRLKRQPNGNNATVWAHARYKPQG